MKSRTLGLSAALAAIVAGSPSLAAEINVAVMQSLTGSAAFIGTSVKDGMLYAADEINRTGFLGNGNTLKVTVGALPTAELIVKPVSSTMSSRDDAGTSVSERGKVQLESGGSVGGVPELMVAHPDRPHARRSSRIRSPLYPRCFARRLEA